MSPAQRPVMPMPAQAVLGETESLLPRAPGRSWMSARKCAAVVSIAIAVTCVIGVAHMYSQHQTMSRVAGEGKAEGWCRQSKVQQTEKGSLTVPETYAPSGCDMYTPGCESDRLVGEVLMYFDFKSLSQKKGNFILQKFHAYF